MISPFRKLFTEHPESVGETYGEHLLTAMSFGTKMVVAGIACMIHGVLPRLFMTRGSDMVGALHEQMLVNRRQKIRSPLIH